MNGMDECSLEQLDKRIALMLPLLNERQRRLYLAAEAITSPKNSVSVISNISGVSRNTIASGIRELQGLDDDDESSTLQNVRKRGAGRKKIHEEFPELNTVLRELLCERGMSNEFFSWSRMSIREIREVLKEKGYWVGRTTVANMLQEMGYMYYDSEGSAQELYEKMKSASGSGIPAIDLEIVGTIHDHLPNRVWDFIKNWWKADPVMVVSSLPASGVVYPDGILYYPYPSGYIRWEYRKICATLRPPEADRENELRCLFWQLGE